MHSNLEARLDSYLNQRREAQLLRELKVAPCVEAPGAFYLNHNDYLQLSKHPTIIQAAQKALEQWGSSARGSPVVGSYWEIHHALESALTQWCGFAHGLLWNSGYTANKALLSTLPQRGDLVLADQYVHNSMLVGALEVKVRLMRYRHLDLSHLEELLKGNSHPDRTIFVVTESVFSMEGDYPDFKAFKALKERYNFFWIVDEAHAIGWYGPTGNGIVGEFALQSHVDILVATLGKSLASQGAFTLFHNPKLRSYFVNCVPEFIYSTYLTPAAAAASLAAVTLIQTSYSSQLLTWRQQAQALRQQLQSFFPSLPLYDSPIIPLIIKSPEETVRMASQLAQRHIYVGAIRPPSVPLGTSRLRLSLHCKLDFERLGAELTDYFRVYPKNNYACLT